MFRNKLWISTFALVLIFSVGGCASKKGPQGAAAGAGGTSEGGATPGEVNGGAGAAGAMDALSSLPITHFDYNQAVIRSEAKGPLKAAAETLKSAGNAQVTVEGHCDERGSSEYNLALGERRAQAVKSYLRTLGIDGQKLSTISYGKERPADPAHTEEAWAKNRRAELIVNR